VEVTPQLAWYVTEHYTHLFTDQERRAWRHLATTYKATGGRSDPVAQAEVRAEGGPRARWLSDDAAVLELTAAGIDPFRVRAAERILREHAAEVFLNLCPRCGGLTRTPRAKLCLHCGHAWHHEAAS
jgi:hypothetical protein